MTTMNKKDLGQKPVLLVADKGNYSIWRTVSVRYEMLSFYFEQNGKQKRVNYCRDHDNPTEPLPHITCHTEEDMDYAGTCIAERTIHWLFFQIAERDFLNHHFPGS